MIQKNANALEEFVFSVKAFSENGLLMGESIDYSVQAADTFVQRNVDTAP